ncbi:MAG: crotonase/enoyl-CoA hydratase family protein [Pseudomonadota bacterium]
MAVRVEKKGPVTTVIHSRPEVRNAMDPESAEALEAAFLAFDADPEASVAVFYGEGGAFCAGWDLSFAASLKGETNPLAALDFTDDESRAPRGPMGPSRLALTKPVIAAVAGPAVAGGFELALWCDLRVVEETAYFGVYCRRWGIPLIDGGTVRLPRIIGRGRALDLILTGRKVEADEALRMGLCDRVVAPGAARDAAEALAADIARFPQTCVRADRQSVFAQEGLDEASALRSEWAISSRVVEQEGLDGATRFKSGKGRHGDFGDIA